MVLISKIRVKVGGTKRWAEGRGKGRGGGGRGGQAGRGGVGVEEAVNPMEDRPRL